MAPKNGLELDQDKGDLLQWACRLNLVLNLSLKALPMPRAMKRGILTLTLQLNDLLSFRIRFKIMLK